MNQNNLTIPFAIVVAAALVAGAIIYTRTTPPPAPIAVIPSDQVATIDVPAITAKDHILGNADAQVALIEYSDTECPFCKQFQASMHKMVDTYSKDNQVVWVYRQFPIPQLHPKAPKEAESTECVNELGGATAFWKYLDSIYATTPSNNGLDAGQLPILAGQAGVDVKAFNTCLSSGRYTDFITQSFNAARALGAQGTPYTVIVPKAKISSVKVQQLYDLFTVAATQLQTTPDRLGTIAKDGRVVLNGALPYELIKQIVAVMVS